MDKLEKVGMINPDTSKKNPDKIPNSGIFLGAVFAVWTIVFTLADYYRTSERPFLVWVTIAGLFGAALASFMFVWLSRIARNHVRQHPKEVEEGGYCPWAYFGGIAIVFALILMGLGVEYLAYTSREEFSFPTWEVVLLGANTTVVAMSWWTHLVITERQPPVVPRYDPEKEIFLEALRMETQFLRVIIGALTQCVYLLGFGLFGAASFFLTKKLIIEESGYLILLGLGVWVLGLHLAITSPFMRRHGEIIRAMTRQAQVGRDNTIAPEIKDKMDA